jgi:hypothetical protein
MKLFERFWGDMTFDSCRGQSFFQEKLCPEQKVNMALLTEFAPACSLSPSTNISL